jgi:hypothetical protein
MSKAWVDVASALCQLMVSGPADFASCVRVEPARDPALGCYCLVTTRAVAAGALIFVDTAVALSCLAPQTSDDEFSRAARGTTVARAASGKDFAQGLCLYLETRFPANRAAQRAYLAEYATLWPGQSTTTLSEQALAVWRANSYPMCMGAAHYLYDVGFFPILARCNHACTPNTMRFCHGPHMLLFAAEALAAGTELTTFYASDTEFTRDRAIRRAALLNDMHFVCQCSVCRAGPFSVPETPMFDTICKWISLAFRGVDALQTHKEDCRVDASKGLDLAYRLSIAFLRVNGTLLLGVERDLVVTKCAVLLLPARLDAMGSLFDKWCEFASELVTLLGDGRAYAQCLWYGAF